MKKPIIGISVDYELQGSFSQRPHYALRENYAQSVSDAGGIPLLLPLQKQWVLDYARMLDGLMLTGGDFDIDPMLYGEAPHPKTKQKPKRTEFEAELLREFYKTKKPILGICNGMQLIGALRGGALWQDIPDQVKTTLDHSPKGKGHELAHDVEIQPQTRLAAIVGASKIKVNSSHHQAVKSVSAPIIISAESQDGIIEAVEDTAHPFCLGVQWHPEYYAAAEDKKIFDAFIAACAR